MKWTWHGRLQNCSNIGRTWQWWVTLMPSCGGWWWRAGISVIIKLIYRKHVLHSNMNYVQSIAFTRAGTLHRQRRAMMQVWMKHKPRDFIRSPPITSGVERIFNQPPPRRNHSHCGRSVSSRSLVVEKWLVYRKKVPTLAMRPETSRWKCRRGGR